MSYVIYLKQAIKGIDTLLKNQWYNDHKDFVELKYKLSKRLEEVEELIASGELPDCVIEEWSEKTERELRIMGIKVTKVWMT